MSGYRRRLIFLMNASAVLIVSLTACAGARAFSGSAVQTGMASWYGPDFHGRPTSNREIYDMYDMTAAHRTLPFGTLVMVTNLDNGRAASVRINDRGPFVKDRIIDLSYAAAKMLDMIGAGTAPVRLEILKSGRRPLRNVRYAVQIGSFIYEQNALDLKTRLGNRYGRVVISPFATPNGIYYRVRFEAGDRRSAEELARRLSADGFGVLICEIE